MRRFTFELLLARAQSHYETKVSERYYDELVGWNAICGVRLI